MVAHPFRRAMQLGDVPRADLVRPGGNELGLDGGGVGSLRAVPCSRPPGGEVDPRARCRHCCRPFPKRGSPPGPAVRLSAQRMLRPRPRIRRNSTWGRRARRSAIRGRADLSRAGCQGPPGRAGAQAGPGLWILTHVSPSSASWRRARAEMSTTPPACASWCSGRISGGGLRPAAWTYWPAAARAATRVYGFSAGLCHCRLNSRNELLVLIFLCMMRIGYRCPARERR